MTDTRALIHFCRPGVLLCVLFALLTSTYYWSPLVKAKWSMADDHDIVSFIGQRDRLPITEIPRVLIHQTEVGKMGADQRFRPSYYLLHLLQASTLGKNSSAWYAARIAIALLFAVTLTIVALRIAAPISVLGFISYELSRPYWSDIFARLGDGESYCALGLSIFTIGVMVGLRRTFTGGVCAAVALGLAIAAGSKENFVLLAVVPIWIMARRAPTVTTAGRLWLTSAILYSASIAVIVSTGVYNAGRDYYYHPVSLGTTWQVITQAFQHVNVWIWLLGSLFLWRLIRAHEQKGVIDSATSRMLKRDLAAILVLLLVYVSQVVFYSGQDVIDREGRYLFPQSLAQDVSILIAIAIITRLIVERGRANWGAALKLATAACFLIAASKGWNQNRLSAMHRVAESREFTERIETGITFLKQHPSAVLILNSHSPRDIEPVWSIMEFVRAAGVSNAVAVKVTQYSSYALQHDPDPLVPVLAAQVEDIQANGRVGGFVSLDALPRDAECYSYGLHGPPAANCTGEIIWPPGRSVDQFRYDGDIVSFASGGSGAKYLASGWSQAEDWGVWSDGRNATLMLRDATLADKANVELVVEARGFITHNQPMQRVRVQVNEIDAGELLLGWDITQTSLRIPAPALKSSLLQIVLVPERPLSPAKAGLSSDDRLLGIGLKSLQLKAATKTQSY